MAKDDETKRAPPAPKVEDPDRAAILARRQRFIAIALSGLTTGTACAKSEPCLNVALPPDEQAEPIEPGRTTGDVQDTGDVVTAPQPCLEVASPQPCLDVIEPEPEPKTAPQACLKVAPPEPAPQPCLDVLEPEPEPAPPQPCLRVAAPREPEPAPEPKPKPQPCLRVR
ncbi:MAG: hypothetical protein R3A79_08050 [Nannocystaceae bacterium]